ncbi:MAG: thiamine phosphate synthase [Actinomycetota bacterium]
MTTSRTARARATSSRSKRTVDARRERLDQSTLYLCTGIMDGGKKLAGFLQAVLKNGVDVVQLREKVAGVPEIMEAGNLMARLCKQYNALFIVNDRVDLAMALKADGVHLGQEDLPPEIARKMLGKELLIGRSVHSSAELKRANQEPVDYLGVGPVHKTPTHPKRKPVGMELVGEASETSEHPFFITGGMNPKTIPEIAAAGARRFVVVRALTEAKDPAAAAKDLMGAISVSVLTYAQVHTPLGPGWVAFSSKGAARMAAGISERAFLEQCREALGYEPEPAPLPKPQAQALARGMARGDGTGVDFSRFDGFELEVLQAVAEVRHGQTVTYADIAKKVKNPKASRAVGNIMANNPLPLLVPCHRVLPSSGKIGNYSMGGPEMKKKLLENEGVELED